MKTRDTLGLVFGLIFLAVGALGLWAAFGTVNGKILQIAIPLALVGIGASGLLFSRRKTT